MRGGPGAPPETPHQFDKEKYKKIPLGTFHCKSLVV